MDEVKNFIVRLEQSLNSGTFVKLTLGNYRGDDDTLQKILIRPVEIKKGRRVMFQYRNKTGDRVENFARPQAVSEVGQHLSTGFRSAHLFTTESDVQLTIGKRSARMTSGKPTFTQAGPTAHDRKKNYLVDPNAYYLKALGITTDSGKIRNEARDKWKQIIKFVEIIAGLYESSDLKDKPSLKIVDMGSGKGYLTFAAYEYFGTRTPLAALSVTGVESRPYLVELCNQIAWAGGYEGLKFVPSNIAEFETDEIDILIALHACDTATDDALFKGISGKASVIIAAPCCHHEIKAQMKPPELLAGILEHAVLHERTAETLTDGLRSLLLEREGYKTKLFEFVSTEHTPKNNMLTAVKRSVKADLELEQQISDVMKAFDIEHQHLDSLLKSRKAAP